MVDVESKFLDAKRLTQTEPCFKLSRFAGRCHDWTNGLGSSRES